MRTKEYSKEYTSFMSFSLVYLTILAILFIFILIWLYIWGGGKEKMIDETALQEELEKLSNPEVCRWGIFP